MSHDEILETAAQAVGTMKNRKDVPAPQIDLDSSKPKFPDNERTSQFHFNKWVKQYYPGLGNEDTCFLRKAFKRGFEVGQDNKEKK